MPTTVNTFEESSSVAPGAHEDQFRRMRYPTEKSMNDPDRVFYTTTSMTEGIRYHPQPPWYYGYQNKTKPTDSNIVSSAARYGYRGSRDIQQFHTDPRLPPTETLTEYTPAFLIPSENVTDEWVPPIRSAPLTNGYALTSPKLWPENAEYANGYREGVPTSPVYIRETTAGSHIRPYTSPSVQKIKEQKMIDTNTLRESSRLESRGLLESRPRSQQSLFVSTWNEKLTKNATGTLRQTMRRQVPPYEAHTLMDPTDEMRYAGGTAMIVHSSSAEELKFKMHMEMYRTNIPFELRWKQVVSLFRILRSRLKREQTSEQAILDFAETLRKEAFSHGQKAALLRAHFIKAMSATEVFEHLLPKQMSLLFSVFDPLKKSMILFVDVIAAFCVLDTPQKYKDDEISLLLDLWKLYDYYGDDQQPSVVVEAVLCTCCGSTEDHKEIQRLFKETLRPALYRLAIKGDTASGDDKKKKTNHEKVNPLAQSVHLHLEEHQKTHPKPPNPNGNAGRKSGIGNGVAHDNPLMQAGDVNRKKKHLIIRPVYNIYDAQFDVDMFKRLLLACPEIVAVFNRHLTQRLVQCYGKDPREVTEEVNDIASEKDFSWILGKKK